MARQEIVISSNNAYSSITANYFYFLPLSMSFGGGSIFGPLTVSGRIRTVAYVDHVDPTKSLGIKEYKNEY